MKKRIKQKKNYNSINQQLAIHHSPASQHKANTQAEVANCPCNFQTQFFSIAASASSMRRCNSFTTTVASQRVAFVIVCVAVAAAVFCHFNVCIYPPIWRYEL
ncbi:unnamed protein product [Ceratitis capitata]|uniref:(Mediterranean fruit fly) hypothetical protein n=1 Tax=Ceratitis capitata TaxID=7213 RepID=A0A811U5U2_CERCA|nr:unnamed protein product [Ceratitis capitata]